MLPDLSQLGYATAPTGMRDPTTRAAASAALAAEAAREEDVCE